MADNDTSPNILRANGMREPQRRFCRTTTLGKFASKAKTPRYNKRR
jgi:hypothetical protein